MGDIREFVDEELRLGELARYSVVMEEKEEVFCDLARLAMLITKTPLGGVSLVDQDHVWLKGRVGVELACLEREGAFCSYAVESNEDYFLVADTLADPRFVDNPLVANAPHIRHYAAANLLGHRGYRLGTLWVMDTKPRDPSQDEREAMLGLGAQVVRFLELRYQNPVSGLANRGAFVSNLQCALNQQRGGSQVCRIADCRRKTPDSPCLSALREEVCVVGYIQIHNLHIISGAYGGKIRQELLLQLTQTLREWVGTENMLAHLEGDNIAFALFSGGSISPDQRLDSLRQLLARPWAVADALLHLSTAVGVSRYPATGVNAASLLDQAAANASLQQPAVGDGAGQAMKTMVDSIDLQRTLATDIREHRVVTHYQPRVDAVDGVLLGFEALARLNHPRLGLLGAERFVPLAEESGLVRELDMCVIETVCADLRRWQIAGLAIPSVSVNMACATLLYPSIVEDVREICGRYGVAPARIAVDIAAQGIAEKVEAIGPRIAELRALGCAVAVDRFGEGLANLGFLRGIRFDRLNVDRKFVHGVSVNAYLADILRFVKGIADMFEVDLVCHGVEQPEDLSRLIELGYRNFQGWYFCSAVAPEAVPAMFERMRTLDASGRFATDAPRLLVASLRS